MNNIATLSITVALMIGIGVLLSITVFAPEPSDPGTVSQVAASDATNIVPAAGQPASPNMTAQAPAATAAEAAVPAKPWSRRCADEAQTQCEIVQRLNVQETGQRFAELAIGFPEELEDGAARAVMILPLGISLRPGVAMKIDERDQMNYDVNYCDPNGCVVLTEFPTEEIEAMKTGQSAFIGMRSATGQDITVPITLQGFTAALDALRG